MAREQRQKLLSIGETDIIEPSAPHWNRMVMQADEPVFVRIRLQYFVEGSQDRGTQIAAVFAGQIAVQHRSEPVRELCGSAVVKGGVLERFAHQGRFVMVTR